jgi:hypothetical protein
MRPAAKHWLFLAFLIASLAAIIAVVLWKVDQARREAANRPRVEIPAEKPPDSHDGRQP